MTSIRPSSKSTTTPAETPLTASDHSLLQGIRKQLDAHAEGLDAATASRLHLARNQALKAAQQGGLRQWFRRHPISLWASSGIAAAALAVVVLIGNPSSPLDPAHNDGPLATIQTDTDLEILASNDGLDLYQDIDFYMWLSDQTASPELAPTPHEVRPSPEQQAS